MNKTKMKTLAEKHREGLCGKLRVLLRTDHSGNDLVLYPAVRGILHVEKAVEQAVPPPAEQQDVPGRTPDDGRRGSAGRQHR